MNQLLKLESAALLLLSYLATTQLSYAWWMFFAWLLAPDVSMIGYAVNTRVGAVLYNLAHHQGIAIAVGLAGWFGSYPVLQFAGCILLGHSAMDRVFGYGLKYQDAFTHTHLGWLKQSSAKR